jgi:predicted branched-subunit amino acid permease
MPAGLLFCVLASKAHWTAIDVLLISAFGFTGSGQFALLPLYSDYVYDTISLTKK